MEGFSDELLDLKSEMLFLRTEMQKLREPLSERHPEPICRPISSSPSVFDSTQNNQPYQETASTPHAAQQQPGQDSSIFHPKNLQDNLQEKAEEFSAAFMSDYPQDYPAFSAHRTHNQYLIKLSQNLIDSKTPLDEFLLVAEKKGDFQGAGLGAFPLKDTNPVSVYAISIHKRFCTIDRLNDTLLKQSGISSAFDIINPEKLNNQKEALGKLLSPALFLEDSSSTPPVYKLYKKGTLELI